MRHDGKITKRIRLVLFACAVGVACNYKIVRHMSQDQSLHAERVKVIESVIRGGVPPADGWAAVRIREGSLQKIQMLSDTHGWTASLEGSLYKTTDGGDTWQRAENFRIPKDAYVTDFSFSDLFGSVAIAKNDFDFDEDKEEGTDDDATWIMNTSDGGESWHPVYTKGGAQITRIAMINTSEGWAAGRKFKTTASDEDRAFLIRSTDRGKTWTDVSERLPLKTAGVDTIHVITSLQVILVTSDGNLLRTRDGGDSWSGVGTLPRMREQIGIFRIGITGDNLLWVLGGTGGLEGTQSVIATKRGDNFWTKYVLDGVYLRDAVFLSDSRVVACGSMIFDEESSPERNGIVLSSDDGARSWTVTYRNPKLAGINSLSAKNSTYMWAGGERGLILRSDLPSKVSLKSVEK